MPWEVVETNPAYTVLEDELGRRRIVAAGQPGFQPPVDSAPGAETLPVMGPARVPAEWNMTPEQLMDVPLEGTPDAIAALPEDTSGPEDLFRDAPGVQAPLDVPGPTGQTPTGGVGGPSSALSISAPSGDGIDPNDPDGSGLGVPDWAKPEEEEEKRKDQPMDPYPQEEKKGPPKNALEGAERIAGAIGQLEEDIRTGRGNVEEKRKELDGLYKKRDEMMEQNELESQRDLEEMRNKQEKQKAIIDQEEKELDGMKEDPNRVWNNKSTGQKVAYYISAAIQGYLDAKNKRPLSTPNVVKMLEREIQQDLQSQRNDIMKKERKVGRMWNSYSREQAEDRWDFGHREKQRDKRYQTVLNQIDDQMRRVQAATDDVQAIKEIGQLRIQTEQVWEAGRQRDFQENLQKQQLEEQRRARRARSSGGKGGYGGRSDLEKVEDTATGPDIIEVGGKKYRFKQARFDPKTGKLLNTAEYDRAKQYAIDYGQIKEDIRYLRSLKCGVTDRDCHKKWNDRAAGLRLKIARMSGEKGPLSETDVKTWQKVIPELSVTGGAMGWVPGVRDIEDEQSQSLDNLEANMDSKWEVWGKVNLQEVGRTESEGGGGGGKDPSGAKDESKVSFNPKDSAAIISGESRPDGVDPAAYHKRRLAETNRFISDLRDSTEKQTSVERLNKTAAKVQKNVDRLYPAADKALDRVSQVTGKSRGEVAQNTERLIGLAVRNGTITQEEADRLMGDILSWRRELEIQGALIRARSVLNRREESRNVPGEGTPSPRDYSPRL